MWRIFEINCYFIEVYGNVAFHEVAIAYLVLALDVCNFQYGDNGNKNVFRRKNVSVGLLRG